MALQLWPPAEDRLQHLPRVHHDPSQRGLAWCTLLPVSDHPQSLAVRFGQQILVAQFSNCVRPDQVGNHQSLLLSYP
jgi:hypothetical protein